MASVMSYSSVRSSINDEERKDLEAKHAADLKRKADKINPVLNFTKRLRVDIEGDNITNPHVDISLDERLKMMNLLEAQLRLTDTVYRLSRGIMEDYAGGAGLYGMSPSQAVQGLSKEFKDCNLPEEIEFRAMQIYKSPQDIEAQMLAEKRDDLKPSLDAAKARKENVDNCRATLLIWWKKLHDLHKLYDDQVPGLLNSITDEPGSGRAVYQYKLLTALDVANWMTVMKKDFKEWKVSGKAELYDWMETILIAAKKLPAEFLF